MSAVEVAIEFDSSLLIFHGLREQHSEASNAVRRSVLQVDSLFRIFCFCHSLFLSVSLCRDREEVETLCRDREEVVFAFQKVMVHVIN